MKIMILFFFVFLSFYSCNLKTNNIVENKNYKGIITNKYQELMNHDMWEFQVNSDEINFEVGAQHFPKSWEFAEIGDSIFKKRGCLYITIKKQSGDSARFFYK